MILLISLGLIGARRQVVLGRGKGIELLWFASFLI